MSRKAVIKLVTVVVLSVICLIIVLQNTDKVDADILWISVPQVPLALLLFLTGLLGFIVGVLVSLYLTRKDKNQQHAE